MANTSVIAGIAAFVFGLLYCYELLVDLLAKKITMKELQKPFIVFSVGSIIILLQMVNYTVPNYSANSSLYDKFRIFYEFFRFADYWPKNCADMLQTFLLLAGIVFFRKNKKAYFFVLISSALLISIALKVYFIAAWHYMFLFLFYVCAMWIYMQENKIETRWQKVYYTLFLFLSFLQIFYFKFPWHWNGFYMPATNFLRENIEQYKGAKIFLYPTDTSIIGIVPMLKDYDINFFGPHGTSYETCKTYVKQWDAVKIDFEAIKKEMLSEPEKINQSYIFVPTVEEWKKDLSEFLKYYKQNNSGVKIKLYKKMDDFIIYKLSVEN